MDDTVKKNEKEIQWHPAFVVALQAILIDYKDVLEYRFEHPLTAGSLSIDILVVKKRPDAVIKRQIAEIFRQDNIIEYKSPTDSLSVNEFYKAFARAHLYKALDDVDVAGLTLSFVVSGRPRELFRHLTEALGYTLEERHSGVFVVGGAIIPIQIIDIKKLSEDENLWLRNLNRNLSENSLLWAQDMKQKQDARLDLSAWIQAVFAANHEAIKEIFSKEDNRMLTAQMRRTLEEIGLGEIWRQEGWQEGKLEGWQKGKLEGKLEGIEEVQLSAARAMLAEGDSFEKIARVFGIPQKTLKAKLSRK